MSAEPSTLCEPIIPNNSTGIITPVHLRSFCGRDPSSSVPAQRRFIHCIVRSSASNGDNYKSTAETRTPSHNYRDWTVTWTTREHFPDSRLIKTTFHSSVNQDGGVRGCSMGTEIWIRKYALTYWVVCVSLRIPYSVSPFIFVIKVRNEPTRYDPDFAIFRVALKDALSTTGPLPVLLRGNLTPTHARRKYPQQICNVVHKQWRWWCCPILKLGQLLLVTPHTIPHRIAFLFPETGKGR